MANTPSHPQYTLMKDTHIIDRLSDDQLWDQVTHREPGDFLYAVTTMGIYCRPGCPSPRPLRKNVRYFRNIDEAETAGFRACRRCDPKGDRARLAQAVVQDACAFIESSEEIPSLDTLATRSGYSRFHFLRMFRDHTGLTPRSYAEVSAPNACTLPWPAAPASPMQWPTPDTARKAASTKRPVNCSA